MAVAYGIINDADEYLRYMGNETTPPFFAKTDQPNLVRQWARRNTAEKNYNKLVERGITNIKVVEVPEELTKESIKNSDSVSHKNVSSVPAEILESTNEIDENFDSEEMFTEYHEQCMKCSKECKQSAKVKMYCPDYRKHKIK